MLLIHLLPLSSLRKREGVNREEEKKWKYETIYFNSKQDV